MIEPKEIKIDPKSGALKPCDNHIIRRLSNVQGVFYDQDAAEKMLAEGDRIIYEVCESHYPEEPGHLKFSTTILYPGKVGDEYFITKGHYHEVRNTAEFYYGLSGKGMMLMENERGDFKAMEISEGIVVYVPPLYAHRAANTGDKNLIILCVYPADAGHDYDTIEKAGFKKRAVERNGKVELVEIKA